MQANAMRVDPMQWQILNLGAIFWLYAALIVAEAVRARGKRMNHWQIHEVTTELYDLEDAIP